MRKLFYIVLIIVVFSFFMGCWSSHKNASFLLQKAESVMTIQPDSALYWLQSIENPEQLDDELRAWYALLLTQAKYKNFLPVDDDSLLLIAYNYYTNTSDSTRKAWTCFYLAQIYRDMRLKSEALSFFFKADRAGKEMKDYHFKHLLYYHWGNLFSGEVLFEEALGKMNIALSYAELLKDTTKILFAWRDISWIYMGQKKYDQAYFYLRKAISLATDYEPNSLPWLNFTLAITYKYNKQPRKALKFINRFLETNSFDTTEIEKYYLAKSLIFIDLCQYDSARYYLQKDQRYNTIVEKGAYHLNWAELEEAIGNYQESLRHRKLYDTYQDSIYKEGVDQKMLDLQKRYDYMAVKVENGELKIEQQHSRLTLLFTSLALVVTLLLAVVCFILYTRSKRSKEEAIRLRESLAKQLDIDALKHNMDLQCIQKDKEKLLAEHETVQKDYRRQHQEMAEEILRNDQIIIKIRMFSESISQGHIPNTQPLSEEELVSLMETVDVCHNRFTQRLRAAYSKLSSPDIYLCCLLRLDIPEWSILYLLDVNKATLRKRKSRLKSEKLELQESDSLDLFLHTY